MKAINSRRPEVYNPKAVLRNILQMHAGRVKVRLSEAASSPGIRNIFPAKFSHTTTEPLGESLIKRL